MRRALAGAGRKAVEVDALVVAAPLVPTAEACRGLARRALGRHGSEILTLGMAVAGDRAEALAMGAAAALDAAVATGATGAAGAAGAAVAAVAADRGLPEDWGLAVCVGLGPDGTTVALCLSRR